MTEDRYFDNVTMYALTAAFTLNILSFFIAVLIYLYLPTDPIDKGLIINE